MNATQDCWLDVAEFGRAVSGENGRVGELTSSRFPTIHQLEQAITLYNGQFLAGFSLPDSAPFEEWLRFASQTCACRQQSGCCGGQSPGVA